MKKLILTSFLAFQFILSTMAKAEDSKKPECLADLCIDELVYANHPNDSTSYKSEKARIVGFDNGTYVLHFETGSLKGQFGNGWKRDHLATLSSCSKTKLSFCVDESVIASRDGVSIFEGKVVGIQGANKNKLVISFGKEGVYGNYDPQDTVIYKTKGQSGKFQVNSTALNKDRNNIEVKILGYNSQNQFMLEFLNGKLANSRGGKWTESSLIFLAGKCAGANTDSKSKQDSELSQCNNAEVTVEKINEELKLPSGSQIIIKQKLYIPRNKGCGAPAESPSDTQCFICQSNAIPNSTLYETEGILTLSEAKLLPNKSELQVQIVDSDDLNLVRCISKTGQQLEITSFEGLQTALNESGIFFKDPAPVLKSFGKSNDK